MSSNQGVATKIPLDSTKLYPKTWHTTQEQLVRNRTRPGPFAFTATKKQITYMCL